MGSKKLLAIASWSALALAMTMVACSSSMSGGESTYRPPVTDEPETMGDTGGSEGETGSGEGLPELGSEGFSDSDGSSGGATSGGSAQLRVKVMMSGQPGSGNVRILTADVDRSIVTEGPSSQTFDLPAGEYDLEVRLNEALDRPEKTFRNVRVPPAKTTVHEVSFTVGELTLNPRQGRRVVGKSIRWRYTGAGDWFEQATSAGEEVILSAGRYDAEVEFGRQKITISDIQVYEGKRSLSPEIRMR